jgi:hypothetical protein
MTMTHTEQKLEHLASGLLGAWRAAQELRLQKHPQKAFQKNEEVKAMCSAAHRLGIGMTPTEVFMAVKDVADEYAPQSTDSFRVRNEKQRESIPTLAQRLKKLDA